MATLGTDVNIFESYYAPSEIRDIFSEQSVVESWLLFESALAEVQGALGLIPEAAAVEIKKKATLEHVRFERIVDIYGITRHPGLATIRALVEVCENNAGEWVHYGSSAPELWENALAYQLRQVMDIFERDLDTIRTYLNRLASEHKYTVMVERSLGKQALPTTFGFVAAIWSDAISQNITRFRETRKRVLKGFLKGVVGTYAAHHKIAGDRCLEMEKMLLDRLGLYSNDISFSRHLERLTEFMNLLVLLAQTFEKIFNDIFFLQHDEIAELEEPFDIGGPSGSSSLPQKRNPVLCLSILARCKKVRSNAAAFGDTHVQQSHDTTAFSMQNLIIPESSILTGDILHNAKYIFKDLHVYPDAMKKNLHLTGGLVMTEALMLGLAKKTRGKQAARDLVRKAVMESLLQEIPFIDVVSDNPEIREYLSKEEIESLLLPENHLGLIDRCIENVIKN